MNNLGKKFGEEPSFKELYILPEGLTPGDIGLIKERCIAQNANSKEQIEGFANAYLEVKQLAQNEEELKSLDDKKLLDLILRWAGMIEKVNKKSINEQEKAGFRFVPAGFQDGSAESSSQQIERAMELFCDDFIDGDLNPEKIYKEFENIRPFEHGNGRIGDLLWRIAVTRETREWPMELPPDIKKGNSY